MAKDLTTITEMTITNYHVGQKMATGSLRMDATKIIIKVEEVVEGTVEVLVTNIWHTGDSREKKSLSVEL